MATYQCRMCGQRFESNMEWLAECERCGRPAEAMRIVGGEYELLPLTQDDTKHDARASSGGPTPTSERPIGISFLAVLYVLGGLALLGIQAYYWGSVSSDFESLGFSSRHAMIAITFLSALGLAGGVGMWTGKTWGWWLGAFYLCHSVARSTIALLSIPGVVEQFGEPDGGVTKHYVRFGGRIAVHSLLVLYFFKSNVVRYFRLSSGSRLKRILLLAGATVGILVIFEFIAVVTSKGGE